MNTSHHSLAGSSLIARASRRCRARGFTLLELMMVLAVTSVLLVLAVPAYQAIGNSMKLSMTTNALLSHLQLARSEAIKRNARVVLCKSADGKTCSAIGGWDQGWIVFHDANNNGILDSTESVIQRIEALPSGWRVAGNQNVSRYVSFVPTGQTAMTSGAFQAGTITVCHESLDPTEARQIVINAVGRPRIQKATLDACT
jgi:type IV fimbrial biogenesis protein FimT